jgi:hypothetical protein
MKNYAELVQKCASALYANFVEKTPFFLLQFSISKLKCFFFRKKLAIHMFKEMAVVIEIQC